MSALAFNPWAVLKPEFDLHPPSNPANPANRAQSSQCELGGLAALAGLAADEVGEPYRAPSPGQGIVLGEDGADSHQPGARLLLMLWPFGAIVAPMADGVLRITPHPSRKRIPPVLLSACRRHHRALAAWVGADPTKPPRLGGT